MSLLKVKKGKKSLSISLSACQPLKFSYITYKLCSCLHIFLVCLQAFMICSRYQPLIIFSRCKYFLPNFHIRSLVHPNSSFVRHARLVSSFIFLQTMSQCPQYCLFNIPACYFDLWCHLHCTYMVSLWISIIQITPPNKYKLESVANPFCY